MVAAVFSLRVLARMSQYRKQVLKCWKFNHFRSGEGLTFFNKNSRANFSGEKKYKEAFRFVLKYAKKLEVKSISSSNLKVSSI